VQLLAANPPPQAAKLQRLLLAVVARQAALTSELRTLEVFEPAFAAALTPVAEANTAARTRLRAAKAPAEVADAVDTYRAAVGRSLKKLRPLRPRAGERARDKRGGDGRSYARSSRGIR
jgi:hypothetical protein